MATSILNQYVGGGQGGGGGGGGGGPVGAVTASNPQKGVKRGILGNPVGVPQQLPGFRGRAIDPTGPIKVPKLRNGNLNNETSNVRVPYSRVAPLEFLSSYTGRLSPGDVVFVHKYPPGFVQSRPQAVNATLGVNSTTRVVGLDGINRLLMGSNPEGWQVGLNVMWLNDKRPVRDANGNNTVPTEKSPVNVTNGGNTAEFALSVLNEYRLDGIVISNDEPGSFTSSGARDNVLLNVAIQGPTECNNGFLMYEPQENTSNLYNPLTGVTNPRTVESYARGSAESGTHVSSSQMPGRVGSPWLPSGKTDFVANFCGTYSMYPAQMFDRRVEPMNSLYLGLRAYNLSTDAKMQTRDEQGDKLFTSTMEAAEACMVFFQYMPFSSRVAAVIGQVTDQHRVDLNKDSVLLPARVDELMDLDSRSRGGVGRAAAAKKVGSTRQRSSISDYSTPFDQCTYDPIRTDDLRYMVGAWHVGRVLDTKASRHDPYAGGPRDTAFSCVVDVGLSWRSAVQPARAGFETTPPKDTAPYFGATRAQKETQQLAYTLVNNAQPALQQVLGSDFGSRATTKGVCSALPRSSQRAAMAAKYFALVQQMKLEQKAERQLDEKRLLAVQTGQIKKLNIAGLNQIMKKAGISDPGYEVLDNPMEFVRKGLEGLLPGQSDNVDATNEAWRTYIDTPRDKKSAKVNAGKRYEAAVKSEVNAVDRRMLIPGRKQVSALVESIRDRLNELGKNKRAIEGVSIKSGDDGELVLLAAKALYTSRTSVDIRTLKSVSEIIEGYLQPLLFGKLPKEGVQLPVEASADADDDTLELMHHLELAIAECDHMLQLSAMHDKVFGCLEALPEAPVSTGAKPRGRSKTPPKTRTGAGAGASTAPAAASGMSTVPLVPTSASPIVDAVAAAASAAVNAVANTLAPVAATPAATASSAAPRRRAREGGESSTTNSVFETMFAASPTAAALEEPASPTPSSGSEGQAPGPRTFRRIQR